MKKLILSLVLIVTFVLIFAVRIGTGKEHKVELEKSVQNLTLKDVTGKTHSLKKLSKEKRATAVIFIATQCPVSDDYNERMAKLFKDYKDKDVQFIGINSNRQESVKEIAKYNKKHGLDFTILKDPDNKVADYFGAKRTPEVYLLDDRLFLHYHGAIDNNRHNPDTHYLRSALDLMIAGAEIPDDLKETKVVGCTIKRVSKRKPKRTP